ncbi:hypothetical protein LEP1GSC108_3279 [Leptospira weilii str. UI 13098]|uniref:Uncharacterized protein n=1 Tax=Leptospira weilii str. UI 13098 TaxID=1088542 RepID=M6QR47_9LEPT|nr:hypothetical protein LEP1GSC108_3279 [Leptospira weilii str. UI 13098]
MYLEEATNQLPSICFATGRLVSGGFARLKFVERKLPRHASFRSSRTRFAGLWHAIVIISRTGRKLNVLHFIVTSLMNELG